MGSTISIIFGARTKSRSHWTTRSVGTPSIGHTRPRPPYLRSIAQAALSLASTARANARTHSPTRRGASTSPSQSASWGRPARTQGARTAPRPQRARAHARCHTRKRACTRPPLPPARLAPPPAPSAARPPPVRRARGSARRSRGAPPRAARGAAAARRPCRSPCRPRTSRPCWGCLWEGAPVARGAIAGARVQSAARAPPRWRARRPSGPPARRRH
mmetsp:Transcript_21537/g.53766  ORF Transcript_21537/g.53766 Transcript_21537/m.53766 type:complete len:217 (-) Transcript_21537:128-778(-)